LVSLYHIGRIYKDNQGSVVAIADEYGKTVESYRYDAFWNLILWYQSNSIKFNLSPSDKNAQTNTANGSKSWITNNRLYTAREYDQELDLYYYRWRTYDARMGRFIQRDPIWYADDVNLYTYVGNNPMNYVDPWGLKGRGVNAENKYNLLAMKHPLYDKSVNTKQEKQINDLIVAMMKDTYDAMHGKENWWVASIKTKETQIQNICNSAKKIDNPYCINLATKKEITELGTVLMIADVVPAIAKIWINLTTKVISKIGTILEPKVTEVTLNATIKTVSSVTKIVEKWLFKTIDDALIHYNKHSAEFMNALWKTTYSYAEYLNDAQMVKKVWTYIPELNWYVKLIWWKWSAKFWFVWVTQDWLSITTFHIKTAKELSKYSSLINY